MNLKEPLIPELVPDTDETMHFNIKANAYLGDQDGHYIWVLDRIGNAAGVERKVCRSIAQLTGKWSSRVFGRNRMRVHGVGDNLDIFQLAHSSKVWNPSQKRWSYRILPPSSDDVDAAMFTINRDFLGCGPWGLNEQWRVYRGRERNRELLLYCVGSSGGWHYKFYTTEADYKADKMPVAELEQLEGSGQLSEQLCKWVPAAFKLTVRQLQDSGLLLSVGTILDMVHERSKPKVD